MILTVWRHGEAEEGVIDRQRELTGTGSDDVGFGCRQFHQACESRKLPHPDRILYSPWVRTAQTAEIIAAAFTHATATPEKALQPGSDVAAVDAALSGFVDSGASTRHLLLVSHQPLVSNLVNHYLGAKGVAPSLSPGGLLTLSFEVLAPGCGTMLFWALPPEYGAGV